MLKTAKKGPFLAIFGRFWPNLTIFKKIDSPALAPLWGGIRGRPPLMVECGVGGRFCVARGAVIGRWE